MRLKTGTEILKKFNLASEDPMAEKEKIILDLASQNEAIQVQAVVSLPCPFCANTKVRTWQTEDKYWHIQCDSNICGASMDDFQTEELAIKQWNVRSK